MGGFDPYSASKGCTELAAASYRRSFFSEKGGALLATARAGNVLGGGDWAEDRLIPDLARAAAAGRVEFLRNPGAVRPWQHVLEPLAGYLELGRKLLEGDETFAEAWNFGPADAGECRSVGEIAALFREEWPQVRFESGTEANALHEARLLQLDCAKARKRLKWHGLWNAEETCRRTARWYRDYYKMGKINTDADFEAYFERAQQENMPWMR